MTKLTQAVAVRGAADREGSQWGSLSGCGLEPRNVSVCVVVGGVISGPGSCKGTQAGRA